MRRAPGGSCEAQIQESERGMKNALRVLVVYPQLPHYRYGVFISMQQSENIEYTFASDILPRNGIATVPLGFIDRHIRLKNRNFGGALWQSRLLSEAIREKYDSYIFLGDVSTLSTWITALLLRIMNRPVLFWTIGWHRRERGWKRLIRMSFYRLANHLLVYGYMGRQLGIAHGYPSHRITVIFNSHNSPPSLEGEEAASSELEFERAQVPVIGAVIRLTPVKNLALLVMAAAELNLRQQPVRILLVGDGPCRGELEGLATAWDVDCHFAGAVYGDKGLTKVYEHMDITVVPTAVGLTAIQSMAYGVPVISDDAWDTQMPEWEAIRPGVTGEHYRKGDVEDLASKVQKMLRHLEQEKESIAEACRAEVATNWQAGRQAERIQSVLNSVS